MTLANLSPATQDALRRWAKELLHDEMALDGISTQDWAWMTFCLRASKDHPTHFPKGKWAVIQHIEGILYAEALTEISGRRT
jgi:hypothetical protein